MTQETAPNGTLNRRRILKYAAAAGTATAGGLLAGSAHAQGAPAASGEAASVAAPSPAAPAATDAPGPGWHRVKLGQATVTTVLDGLRPGDGPHPTFGADQSAETVHELMRANYLPEDRFVNGFTPTLVAVGDELVLFDTGFGERGAASGFGKLVERMGSAGYAPGDVTTVVLTHFHGDHIQGLMTGGSPTFPNARYVAGQVEYDWWTSQEGRNSDRAENAVLVEEIVVPLRDRMKLIAGGDEVVPGITAMEAFGHSPGLLIFEIASDGQRLWLTADVANHFVASLQRPDWEVAFDMNKRMAIETRRRVFDRIAAERIPFIGYHMPFPSIGYAEKTAQGYRFIPESYQLDVAS